jgi:multidrug efflux system outer membrane protein
MRRHLPLLSALAALAAGCAVGPSYEPPVVAVAPAYHTDSDTLVSSSTLPTPFWEELGDTTLSRLISTALSASPDITVALARVRDARASKLNAQLDFAPAITAAAGYTHQQFASAQLPGVPDQFRRFDLWDAGFDASWELDVFGRVRKNVSAQSAFVASAEQDVRATRVTLAAEVARVYFDLRGAQSELEVANRNAENQQRTLALTQERLGAGRGTAFDTERAQSQLSTTLAVTPLLEARITADAHQLDVLLGRVPGAALKELATRAELPALPTSVRVGSPDQLVAERPDVVSAERQLAASRRRDSIR